MSVGEETLDWLYEEQLQIDPQWSVRTRRGFTWWAHHHAQTIEIVDEEEDENGEKAALIRAQTQVARKVADVDRAAQLLADRIMRTASMSGPVLNVEDGTVVLSSLVRIHEGIRPWMALLFSSAAATQIFEAELLADQMVESLEAEPAISGHPKNGVRQETDEIAQLVPKLYVPLGARECRWPEQEFKIAVESYMQRPPAMMATGGGLGFTVEFPYGEVSSLMRVKGDERHPIYGAGLFLLQSFPVGRMTDIDGAIMALRLNAQELSKTPMGYGFGSYCYSNERIHFTSFLPNACYRPGLLPNLYFTGAARARALSSLLMECDWNDMWDEKGRCRAKSSLERFDQAG